MDTAIFSHDQDTQVLLAIRYQPESDSWLHNPFATTLGSPPADRNYIARDFGFQIFNGQYVSIQRTTGEIEEDIYIERGTDTQVLTGDGFWLMVRLDFELIWIPKG